MRATKLNSNLVVAQKCGGQKCIFMKNSKLSVAIVQTSQTKVIEPLTCWLYYIRVEARFVGTLNAVSGAANTSISQVSKITVVFVYGDFGRTLFVALTTSIVLKKGVWMVCWASVSHLVFWTSSIKIAILIYINLNSTYWRFMYAELNEFSYRPSHSNSFNTGFPYIECNIFQYSTGP